jgi:hypothetical protein
VKEGQSEKGQGQSGKKGQGTEVKEEQGRKNTKSPLEFQPTCDPSDKYEEILPCSCRFNWRNLGKHQQFCG